MTASQPHLTPRSTSDDVVRQARSWLYTPYMHQQSLPGIGVDCVGLILGVGRQLDLLSIAPTDWAPFAAYTRRPNPARMRRAMRRFLIEDPTPRHVIPPAGSIGWFGWRSDLPMHLAIVAEFEGRPSMIHAFGTARRCVENSLDEVWLSRVDSWWQYPGLEEF